jgi:metal-dependent amidase/aminoacylase/carboxypeptidase family protein
MDHMPCLAVAHVDVHYTGKEAHASAFPELGINAADALTVAQTAIGLLRQHISPNARIHGIVTKGGDAPNVVPGHTSGKWYIRERTLEQLARLQPRVERCFEAGALATGCDYRIEPQSPAYSEMRDDAGMRQLYRKNAEDLGRQFLSVSGETAQRLAGSTDMANVSLAIPAIHPMLGLGCFPISNHQPEFADFCATPTADKAMRDGAIAMAQTCIDLATDAQQRSPARRSATRVLTLVDRRATRCGDEAPAVAGRLQRQPQHAEVRGVDELAAIGAMHDRIVASSPRADDERTRAVPRREPLVVMVVA